MRRLRQAEPDLLSVVHEARDCRQDVAQAAESSHIAGAGGLFGHVQNLGGLAVGQLFEVSHRQNFSVDIAHRGERCFELR